MINRAVDWNEGLAKDLRDPKFSKEFILAAIDEGLDLKTALAKVVRAYGVKEFSKKAKMSSSNVVRAISPSHNPTQATLNKMLKPFDLELGVRPLRAKAA